jgi:hypothetical protein
MESDRALNLISHRSPESIWDQRGWQGATIEERLGPWLISVAGTGILAYGATRRSWHGVWLLSAVSVRPSLYRRRGSLRMLLS